MAIVSGLSIISMGFYNVYYLRKDYYLRSWYFLNKWVLFIFLIFIYFILSYFKLPTSYGSPAMREMAIMIFIFLVFIFIYKSTVNGHLTPSKLKYLVLFLVLNGLGEIYLTYSNPLIRLGREIYNTSAGYVFIMILPLLMYMYRRYNIWVILLLFLASALTGKRGVIVIFSFLIIPLFANRKMLLRGIKLNWQTGLIFIGTIVCGFFFYEIGYENLRFRLNNIVVNDGIGSGRDTIWQYLLITWHEGSIFEKLFGFGFWACVNIEGHQAHNDFIEVLVNFGLIGLILWVSFYISYFKSIKVMKRIDPYLYVLLLLGFYILVGRSLIAGTFRTDQINWAISMGYLFAISAQKIYYLKNE